MVFAFIPSLTTDEASDDIKSFPISVVTSRNLIQYADATVHDASWINPLTRPIS